MIYKLGRMLLCVRERFTSDSHNHSSLQRQFSHGHSHKSEDGGAGSGTRISHFLPTSRRIVQFSNGKVPNILSKFVFFFFPSNAFCIGYCNFVFLYSSLMVNYVAFRVREGCKFY